MFRERLLEGVERRDDDVCDELSEGERRSGSENWFLRGSAKAARLRFVEDGERAGMLWKGEPSAHVDMTSAIVGGWRLDASVAVTVRRRPSPARTLGRQIYRGRTVSTCVPRAWSSSTGSWGVWGWVVEVVVVEGRGGSNAGSGPGQERYAQ